MGEFVKEINNIKFLEINNCHFIIFGISFNILKDYKNENYWNQLNIILDILNLFSDKVNDKMIIDIIFDNENELPNDVSFYQYFLLVFYSFLNIYYTNNQFILIKFPQLFPKSETINYNYSIEINIPKKEITLNNIKYIYNSHKKDQIEILEKIISQIDQSLLLKNNTLFQYNFTCFAGTFDRCHRGHYFLIQTSLLLSKNNCFIGVCSDEMIKHKCSFSLLQSNYVRKKKIEEIVKLNGYNKNNNNIDIKTIYDPVDMAGIEKNLDCLIVTSETYKGGLYCNEIRKKNNIKPVELCTINVIKININNNDKISSSILRKEILNIISIEKLDKIHLIFKNLLIDLKCENEDLISFWWNEIIEKYTKKWKYYHNINHIYSFIELYNKYNNLIESNKYEFLISIFFHDIIYIPSRNDNEKESIKVFNKFNDEIKSNNLNKDKVIEYIKETENHLLEKDYQNDINLFLDMDMYIIADKNWEDYENKIRNEYSFINYDIYKNRRKEFLLGLQKKKKIFRTEIFYNEYEKNARENINNILKQLN